MKQISKKIYLLSALSLIVISAAVFTLYRLYPSEQSQLKSFLTQHYTMEENAVQLYLSANDTTIDIEKRIHYIDKAVDCWIEITNYWYAIDVKENQDPQLSDIDLLLLEKMIQYAQLRLKLCECYTEVLNNQKDDVPSTEEINIYYLSIERQIQELLSDIKNLSLEME